MLAGPYCPIYGFGMVYLILTTYTFTDHFLALFFASALICSLWEFLVGFTLDKCFHERWWDYSEEPMHIGGYICLRFSILWGLGGAIMIKECHPPIASLIFWLPDKVLLAAILIFSVSMLIDTVLTLAHIRGFNRQVDDLVALHKQMRTVSDQIGRQISHNTAVSTSRIQTILKDPEFQDQINQVHDKLNRTQMRLLKSYPNLKGTKSELQEGILRQWVERTRKD